MVNSINGFFNYPPVIFPDKMNYSSIILSLAFVTDILIGDPVYRFHPIRIMGNWANLLEKVFFEYFSVGIISGIFFWLCMVVPFCLIFLIIHFVFILLNYHLLDFLFQTYIVYSCFAFRDMLNHVKPIYKHLLHGNILSAQKSLRHIVGRDVDVLKEDQIIRATIESISESFVDAFMAPVFWFFIGTLLGNIWNQSILTGVLAIIIYRCANTLDSMVGYRSDRYEKFGKFSARMDDVLNFIPARLCIFVLLPGILISRSNVKRAWKVFLSDRLKSKSPNAAHPMSLFAGALDITLGGSARYDGYLLEKSIIGKPIKIPEVFMIKKSMQIYAYSGIFLVTIINVILFYINILSL